MPALLAYIDMSTGGLLLQVLAMGFMSVLIFFQTVKVFVLGLFGYKPAAKADLELELPDNPTIKLEPANEDEKKAA